jgi:AraC-like DNA-binding protein
MPTIAEELAGAPFSIVDDPEGARHVVGMRVLPEVREPRRVLLDLHERLRHLAGDYGPRSVDLPGKAADVRGWEETFGAEVRPGRPTALLRLPAGVLSGQVGSVVRSTLAWQVRQAISERLGGPGANLNDVARTIAMHPRTVQRSLVDEGLSFARILDCVRRHRAAAYLTETHLPLAEISGRLGFAEPAVLSRCARRWWGRTPSEVRTGKGSNWGGPEVPAYEHPRHQRYWP